MLTQNIMCKTPRRLIDSKLEWYSHVQLAKSKFSRAPRLIFKIRTFTPIAVLEISL